ncbi:hypothetical protein DAEQUDRAFT_811307 [Daedalea quercina L-15889]|uniref:Altered inheritance of mitochondria protein 9, mitochondrial n=1 Tax=Daedalea quercina L-15889 TaxID=1314783 RepID=A0A165QJ27_9APHY|nr:hypothetical protein DAEQUDRAFT_811307 [Daedalea quercina L-15889]
MLAASALRLLRLACARAPAGCPGQFTHPSNVRPLTSPTRRSLSVRPLHLLPSSRPDAETLFTSPNMWLCDNELQQRVRYAPFNPDAIERVACESLGVNQCTSWQILGEGSFNRVFLLRFDSGAEAVVRIPMSLFGNVERATASEVATMCYVRERWMDHRTRNMPFPPKVLAWNATYTNPAQTPYIILEYAPGVPLSTRWPAIEGEAAGAVLQSIAELDCALLRGQTFASCGSLYFAEDAPDGSSPLYANDECDPVELNRKLAAKYRIGPTANREWGRPGYDRVDADRGPWPDMPTMIKAAAEFQLRAMDTVVDFSSSRVKSKPSDIPLLRRLLNICIRVAPLIVPSDPALTAPVLTHPDLTLNNLLVPPEGRAYVHHVIDWQGASIAPYCMQCGVPTAIVYSDGVVPIPLDGSMPPWPEDFDTMPPEQQESVRIHHRYACRHRAFVLRIPRRDPLRADAWALPHSTVLEFLARYITRCISNGPQDLRGLMIYLQQRWTSVADYPCPIDFTKEEIIAHSEEARDQEEYERNVNKLRAAVGCMNDGSVPVEQFEAAKEKMEYYRGLWDETDMKGPFPFYEGAPSYYLD